MFYLFLFMKYDKFCVVIRLSLQKKIVLVIDISSSQWLF